MWLLAILVILLIIGACASKEDKEKRAARLDELKEKVKEDNISASFVCPYGGLAFIDDSQKIADYHNPSSTYTEIKYSDVVQYRRHSNLYGVAFYAFAPEYREFQSGNVGEDNINALTDKLDQIIKSNYDAAIEEYKGLVDLPTNAATVNIKGFSGLSP